MVSLPAEHVVALVLVVFGLGLVLGRAVRDSGAFERVAGWYQRSTPAKTLYALPVVGPALHVVFTDADLGGDDRSNFRALWGFGAGERVVVVVPTVDDAGRPTRALADGGGDGDVVDVGAARLASDRFEDGERYTVSVTPSDVARIDDDGHERVVLYYSDGDGHSRGLTLWASRTPLFDRGFEPGTTYVLSAVRYEHNKGRFHDLVATDDTELLEAADGTTPSVWREDGDLLAACPVEGCDYEATPWSVRGHVNGTKDGEHWWERLPYADSTAFLDAVEDAAPEGATVRPDAASDDASAGPDAAEDGGEPPVVTCPAEGCDYEGEPRSVRAHVSGTRDDDHRWDELPYADSNDFLERAGAVTSSGAENGGDDPGGATEYDGGDDQEATPPRQARRGPGYRNVDAVIHVLLEVVSLYPDADVEVLTDRQFAQLPQRRRTDHLVAIGEPGDDHVERWVDNPHYAVEDDPPAFRDVAADERYTAGETDDGRAVDYGLFVKRRNPNDRSSELVVVCGLTDRSTFDAARAFLPQGGQPGEGDTNCMKALHSLAEPPRERSENPHFATLFETERVNGESFHPRPSEFRRL